MLKKIIEVYNFENFKKNFFFLVLLISFGGTIFILTFLEGFLGRLPNWFLAIFGLTFFHILIYKFYWMFENGKENFLLELEKTVPADRQMY